jgi:hypothetical protein
MSYRDLPHAAVNALMQWVRNQGKQAIRFHAWSHLKGWSSLPEWSAHLEVNSPQPLHVRIIRNGTRFAIRREPDVPSCPACEAKKGAALVS